MKIKALVIDDSRVMRNMVMQSLRRTNLAEFEFVEAEDGHDALGKLNTKTTDVIFVDWNMPKMTGIDFVRRVRAMNDGKHLPIVMVTSEKSVGKMEDALDQAGANEYITKPFTVDDLQRKLGHLFQELRASKPEPPVKRGGFLSRFMTG